MRFIDYFFLISAAFLGQSFHIHITILAKFYSKCSNLFQMANGLLFLRLLFGIVAGVGNSKLPPCLGKSTCWEWDTETLDSLRNVISIHDIIGGILVLGCVQWKILYPLGKYLDITDPVYEGKLVKNII